MFEATSRLQAEALPFSWRTARRPWQELVRRELCVQELRDGVAGLEAGAGKGYNGGLAGGETSGG